MYGIVDSLRTHGIRFVVLRSTSTLDYLFLTRFLHRAYPDAFIVTAGPDMLFGREIDSTEFASRSSYGLSAPAAGSGLDRATGFGARHAHRVSERLDGGVVPRDEIPGHRSGCEPWRSITLYSPLQGRYCRLRLAVLGIENQAAKESLNLV